MHISLASPDLNTRRSGFALVMTLVILALAACAMARIASRSIDLVRRGATAQRELEERWSLATCRLTLVDRSQEILAQAESSHQEFGYGWPYPAEMEVTYALNGQEYEVLIADEDAKLNLNTFHTKKPAQLPSLLAQSAVYGSVPLQLRPNRQADGRRVRAFESWGQVIDLDQFGSDELLSERLRPVYSSWSCWGNSKLNIRRASDEAVRILLERVLLPQETEALLEARRGYQGEWEPLVKTLEIPRRRWILAKLLLSTESTAYSAWVTETTATTHRTRLFVHDPTSRTTPETLLFEW